MSDNELSAKIGLDSTDFKTQVSTLNREIRVLESGFRASAAGMGDWANNANGLTMRIKSLNEQMKIQAQKVGSLEQEYDRVSKAQGKSSRGAQELLIKVNKETEALNKMQTELNQSKTALDGMGDESKQAGKALNDLSDKEDKAANKLASLKGAMSGLGSVLGGLGTTLQTSAKLIAGLGLAVAGVGLAIGGMVFKASNAAGELLDLSNQTGIGIEKLQEMDFVGKQLGVSTDTMAGAFARLTKNMGQAQNGNGEAFDAFKRLGIPVADMNGKLRDSEAVFQDALDALGGVGNETERDALAMALFGKSAQDLNGLIEADSDEIANLTKAAHDMGAVMKEEDVKALEAFGDEIEGLKGGAKGMMGTLASAFLPGFMRITDMAKGYMKDLAGILSGSNGDHGAMAAGIGGLLGRIVNDVAAKLPDLATAGIGILQGIIDAIVGNLGALIPAVIQIISSLAQFIVQNIPMLITAGVEIIVALVNGLITQVPMLMTAAMQMILTLANGISGAIPQLMPAITKIIPEVIRVLTENLPQLVKAAVQVVVTLVNGISEAIPLLVPVISEIIPEFILTLIENLPLLVDAALELIIALVDGLIIALPVLLAAVPEIMTALVDAFTLMRPKIKEAGEKIDEMVIEGITAAWPKMQESGKKIGEIWIGGVKDNLAAFIDMGKQIVSGLWEGIVSKAEWLRDQISGFFKGITQTSKDALLERSPSKVFAGIGENMALGLGAGFTGAFGQISRDINSAMSSLRIPAPNFALAGAGGRQDSPTSTVNVTVPAIINNGIDIYRLARQVAQEIQRAGRG